MAINTQNIRVDLNPGKPIPVAYAHQNDNNREFTFTLYNNGVAYTPSGTTAKFGYKSPIVNGQYSVIAGNSMATGTVSGNTVTVTLPNTYTQVHGVGLLTMILTTSGNTLRPVNIKFVVQSSADGDDVVLGASDWPAGLYEYMDDWLAENEPTEIANLKSDLDFIADDIAGTETQTNQQNNYYCQITALTYGKKYRIGISVATAGTYEIKIGTNGNLSDMVDTLIPSSAFGANEKRYVFYTPSVQGETHVRISTNTVSWSVYVAEVVDVVDLADDVDTISGKVNILEDDVDNAESNIENITKAITTEETQINKQNTNYATLSSALVVGKKYRIGVSVATAGNYGVTVTTGASASTIVATLIPDNIPFAENEKKYVFYAPTVQGEQYIRLSSNTVSWSVYISEVIDVEDILDDIGNINDDLTGVHAYVDNKFEIAGDNLQVFNSANFLQEDDIYIKADGSLISYQACVIFTVELNAHAGDSLVWQFFNDIAYGSENIITITPFTSNAIPTVGGTVIEYGWVPTSEYSNKRGIALLTSNAKYFNVMVRFKTEELKSQELQQMIDTYLLKYGVAYSTSYIGYTLNVIQSIEKHTGDNFWIGKKIWWCGTSIPEGRDTALDSEGSGLSYPELVGQILGATVYNESLGSSMCRANVRTGNYVNAMAVNLVRALAQTTEEKQYLIDNWQTIKSVLKDPSYYDSLDSIADTVRGASFEARLMPYLNGTKPMPDLFVFDHGHNDWKTFYTMPDGTTPDTELKPTTANISSNVLAEDTYMTANSNAKLISFFTEISAIPSDKRAEFIASVNRNCFIGAVNFLCTLILSKNPRARILFIGNIDNWEKPQVQPAQEYLSESWDFHLIKMWEYLGFSGHYIPNTATYWDDEGTTDLTVKKIYCKDGVHPHSDTTGEAIEIYAHTIANVLKDIR